MGELSQCTVPTTTHAAQYCLHCYHHQTAHIYSKVLLRFQSTKLRTNPIATVSHLLAGLNPASRLAAVFPRLIVFQHVDKVQIMQKKQQVKTFFFFKLERIRTAEHQLSTPLFQNTGNTLTNWSTARQLEESSTLHMMQAVQQMGGGRRKDIQTDGLEFAFCSSEMKAFLSLQHNALISAEPQK